MKEKLQPTTIMALLRLDEPVAKRINGNLERV